MSKLARLVSILAILFPIPSAFAIIGGVTTLANDPIASATVAVIGHTTIMGNLEDPYYCTGTLIQPNVVLTAAHCLVGRDGKLLPLSKLSASFGLSGSESSVGSTIRHIVEAKIHPSFNFTSTPGDGNLNDVGLILLDGPAPSGFVTAALANTNPPLTPGTPVNISGYGVTDPNDRIMYSVGTLHSTQSPFISFNADGTELKLNVHGGGVSCLGDSGGPAYLVQNEKALIIGIVSHGTGETCTDGEQVFTSVAAQRGFIDSTLEGWAERAQF